MGNLKLWDTTLGEGPHCIQQAIEAPGEDSVPPLVLRGLPMCVHTRMSP